MGWYSIDLVNKSSLEFSWFCAQIWLLAFLVVNGFQCFNCLGCLIAFCFQCNYSIWWWWQGVLLIFDPWPTLHQHTNLWSLAVYRICLRTCGVPHYYSSRFSVSFLGSVLIVCGLCNVTFPEPFYISMFSVPVLADFLTNLGSNYDKYLSYMCCLTPGDVLCHYVMYQVAYRTPWLCLCLCMHKNNLIQDLVRVSHNC